MAAIKSFHEEMTIGDLKRLRVKRKKSKGEFKDVFEIVGGTDYAFGACFIAKVLEGGKGGGLQVGDRILALGGHGLMSSTLEDAQALMKELPGEFDVLLLRLGKHQWKNLLAKCGKKPQMSIPGPFFKPKCRSINLPMMDGSTSTHGEINVVTITKSTSMLGGEMLPLGLKLICFAKEHVADATKVGCIFITEVQSGGLAARVPLIAKGCRILEINERSTLSITRESAEHKMKTAETEIKMVIQRLDDMQFIRLCKRMLVDASDLTNAEVDKDAVTHDVPGMHMASPSARAAKGLASGIRGMMGLGLGPKMAKLAARGGGGGGGAAAASGLDEDGLPTGDDDSFDEDGLVRTGSTTSHIPSAASIRKSRVELTEMLEESGREEEQLDKSGPVTVGSVANDVMTTSEAELKALAAGKPEDAGDDDDDEEEEESVDGFGVEEDVTEMQMGPFTIEGYNALAQNLATDKDLPPGVNRLNRYFNILPNPATRVKLAQVPGTDETTKYVNANYVMNYDGSNMKQYIASQGPMATARSVADFWRMVWETDCRAILMVTGITERGVEKCARYWPGVLYNQDDQVGDQTFGGYNIRVTAGFRKDGYITSQLRVCKKGEPPRDVYHYWFDSWPDHGVPQRAEPVIAMIDAVRKQACTPQQPWLVHCSAGIGRTGTVIGIDHGIQLLRKQGKAGVLDIIKNLRKCRGGMVQHPEQAQFVQTVLARFAGSNASLNELSVIEESMQRADAAVPTGFTMHASQVDVEEGDEAAVPSWRAKQLEEKRKMELDDLAEDLEELRVHKPDIADRKEKRERAKAAAKAKAGGDIMSMLASGKSIKLPSGRTRGKMMGKSMKVKANQNNPKESANKAHGSVKFGKITARSYATLDGDFHLDSIAEGNAYN